MVEVVGSVVSEVVVVVGVSVVVVVLEVGSVVGVVLVDEVVVVVEVDVVGMVVDEEVVVVDEEVGDSEGGSVEDMMSVEDGGKSVEDGESERERDGEGLDGRCECRNAGRKRELTRRLLGPSLQPATTTLEAGEPSQPSLHTLSRHVLPF